MGLFDNIVFCFNAKTKFDNQDGLTKTIETEGGEVTANVSKKVIGLITSLYIYIVRLVL
jgi:hypothetical protein